MGNDFASFTCNILAFSLGMYFLVIQEFLLSTSFYLVYKFNFIIKIF